MSEPIHILYVDDYPLDRELVRDALEKEHEGFRVTEAASRQEFEARLADDDYDLVLSDFNILGFEGLQVIDTIRAKDPRVPVVIVTGTGSEEVAVEAMKRGAADYVIKTPRHIRRLPHTIHAAMEKQRLEEERQRAEGALKEYSERLEEMVEERTKELRDAQEELVRKERLAVLGQLAGGVAHELRNPLSAISNAVYYLKMVLPDAAETVKEYLEIIVQEVHESDRIISDLLDFSRTRIPDREKVALSELVAEALAKRPPPENVAVVAEIAPELPLVFIDQRQMGQVLVNLVTNAYQAMKEGDVLTISAQVKENQVALSVADTGRGISEDNMEKLFEPLFTTRTKGLGLGLAVAKMLVEANEGSVEVKSEVGQGSTFTVRLPIQEMGL